MTKQAELKKQAYDSDLKSRALSVLIYLIDRSNQELTCFPAISTMARQLHISVSTVKRALRELIAEGYIERDSRYRDNRGQSSNLYTLLIKAKEEVVADSKPIDIQTTEFNSANPTIHITFKSLFKKHQVSQEQTEEIVTDVGETDNEELESEKVAQVKFILRLFVHFSIWDNISCSIFMWYGEEVILRPP